VHLQPFCGANSTATCVSEEGDAGCRRECECGVDGGIFAACFTRCGGEPFTCPGHSRSDGGCSEPTQCVVESLCEDAGCSCSGSGGWLCRPCYVSTGG
jgi:hypothetical protein